MTAVYCVKKNQLKLAFNIKYLISYTELKLLELEINCH